MCFLTSKHRLNNMKGDANSIDKDIKLLRNGNSRASRARMGKVQLQHVFRAHYIILTQALQKAKVEYYEAETV